MGDLVTIPARGGKAARVTKGQTVKVINTHGTQLDGMFKCFIVS